MKNLISTLLLFFTISSSVFSQNYTDFFTDKACRVDFQFCGNNKQTSAYLERIKQEPFWGGRRLHLSEDLNLGQYRFLVTDSASNQLIYTTGFSTLYFEWQSTPEAKLVNKSIEQTVQFPYPKKAVKVAVEKRIGYAEWETLLQFGFSPDDKLIIRNPNVSAQVKNILKNNDSSKAIDIAVIAEGYSAKQRAKFYKDAKQLAENLFTHEPFLKHKNQINIYAIAAVSEDSGITMPHKDRWKNTAVGSHYYTFYEPRYLTSPNVYKIRDYAALVPYDAIYILANTPVYGGGGIYNFYALASADSKRAQAEVLVHEFGHSFAGLADEYFRENADVLDGMYNLKEEPWEPNISPLVNFEAKWKKDLPSDIQIPTPVTEESKTKIGVFEGGGYLTKGMYRPCYDCRMRTNEAKTFCPVCEKAVEKVILFLSE